ncbi:hypothetical protein SHJG_7837 [Streptomyces hygroscopicus subsp. jinggangensis 5008]|nr:hypothetical protein SHJG_7837 [Streptomyces hygroscopicus subsp. jinggangensis 5008]AGF67261.1 hypothetical protein SHJGH_7599 [Streptomyces hygroscopicus subsp. jinggangensis TL01]
MRRASWARRGVRSASMANTLPARVLPVVVPEHAMRPTADGVHQRSDHPQDG